MGRTPAVEIRLGGIAGIGGDPTFYVNSIHTATVTLRNPTIWDFIYYVALTSDGPGAFDGQISPDTPVAAGATTTFTWDITMFAMPVVSPATHVTVSVWDAALTVEDYFVFPFEGVTLIALPIAAAEVTLGWD